MTFARVPDEVWLKVFERLDTSSLLAVERVSTSWNRLTRDGCLWSTKLSWEYPMSMDVACATMRDTYVRLWRREHRWRGHRWTRRALETTGPDGSVCLALGNESVVCGTSSGKCRVWDKSTLTCLGERQERGGCVSEMSLDGDTLVVGMMDGTLCIMDLRRDACRWPVAYLKGGPKDVWGPTGLRRGILSLHRRGPTLVTSGPHGCVDVYDVRMMRSTAAWVSDTKSAIPCVRLTSDGRRVIAGTGDGQMMVWNAADLTVETVWDAHTDVVMSLDMDDRSLLTASYDGDVKRWSLDAVFRSRCHVTCADQEVSSHSDRIPFVGQPMRHDEKVYNVRCVPELPLALTSCQDGTFHLWNPYDSTKLCSVQAHEESIDALACDATCFATGSEKAAVHLWRLVDEPHLAS